MPSQRLRARLFKTRWTHVVRDVTIVGTVLAVAVLVYPPWGNRWPTVVGLVTAVVAAAGCAIAGMLAVLAARLTNDRRKGWLSMVLGCYSLFAMPAATLGLVEPVPALSAVRLLVHTLVVVLLSIAIVAPRPPTGAWQVGGVVLGTSVLVVGVAAWGASFPAALSSITANDPLVRVLDALWTGLGLLIAVLAARRGDRPSWWIGLGIAVLGAAHLGSPTAGVGALAFPGVRLVGLALVLLGTSRLVHRVLERLEEERAAQEEELRLAEIRMARTAERDHELRNGLAGLAGATKLLRTVPEPERHDLDTVLLGTIVAKELRRLDELLQAPDGRARGALPTCYAVEPVLAGLVALRRSSGMHLEFRVEPGLLARGSSTVLAEVVTNLLANTAEHAPGSPVCVSATDQGDEVVIRIRDFGPGIAPGRECAVFERGFRDERSGGLGLGLHVSRTLLASENGSIAIDPSAPDSPGCTVVIRLPAASASERPAVTAMTSAS
jgi:two-component system, OmpR family, sensor kinase